MLFALVKQQEVEVVKVNAVRTRIISLCLRDLPLSLFRMGGGEARYTRDCARAYATFAFGQIHPNRDQRIIVKTKISALNYVYNRHTAAHGTRKFDVNDDI